MPGSNSQGSQKVAISREVWLQNKRTIEDLYVTEALPLNEVRQRLLEINGFCASLSQYKRKLNEWGFAKNLKASDCIAISSSLDRRGLTCDTAKTVVRGRIVRPAHLQRALKRHGVPTWQRKRNQVRRSPTPDEVKVQSIPTSPSNLSIEHALHPTQTNSESLVPQRGEDSPTWAFPGALTVDASLLTFSNLVPPSIEQGTPIVAQLSPPSLAQRQLYTTDSRIPDAIVSGADLDLLRRLLENEADVNGIDVLFETGLNHAVRSQNTQMVRFLLENGASPQGVTGLSYNQIAPLSIAAGHSNLEICAVLLEAGADAKAMDGSSQTALHYAVRSQSVPTVRLLLEYGALSRGRAKNTADDGIEPECMHCVPLSAAEKLPNLEVYEVLVQAVASYLSKYTKLCCTAPKHELDQSLSIEYTEADVSLIPVSCCFERALQLAVCCEKFRLLEVLLRHAKFQSLSQLTWPLFIATRKGYKQAMETLVRHGVGVDTSHACRLRTFDQTQDASFKGRLEEAMPYLVEQGADINDPTRRSHGRTALQHAVKRGDRKTITLMLDHGVDVNTAAAEKQGLTALQAAALSGNIDLVSLLLQRGADVNARPAKESGYTALSAAIESGSQMIFRRLIQAGANINHVEWDDCDNHSTPLVVAIRKRALSFVQELLNFGLDLHKPLPDGWSLAEVALLEASRRHCLPIMLLILQRSSSIRRSVMDDACNNLVLDEVTDDNIGESLAVSSPNLLGEDAPIFKRALWAGCFELVDYLRKHGAQALQSPSNHKSPSAFESTCRNQDLRMCRLMLQYGANANAPLSSVEGRTPLLDACERGYFDLAKLLIEYGADVNASDKSDCGQTALHYLCNEYAIFTPETTPLINRLLDCGADVNAHSSSAYAITALQAVCFGGNLQVVEVLLRHNADVNAAPTADGYTALQGACRGGHLQVVEVLLRHNADVNAPASAYGYTALQAACLGGHRQVVEVLLRHNADVNGPSSTNGYTALQAACLCGDAPVVEAMLRHNADIEARTPATKHTVLQVAARRGSIDIVRTLLLVGADVAAAKPPNGRTAINWAAAGGHLGILELLLQHYRPKVPGDLSLELEEAGRDAQENGHSDVVHFLDTFRRTNASWLSNEVPASSPARRAPGVTTDFMEDLEDEAGEDE